MLFKKILSAITIPIIWAFLFFLACETPTEPPVVKAVLYGKLLEKSPIGVTISIPNAIVTIDGQIDTTTMFGEFQLNLPCGKRLLLQISHPCYLPFGQHIILHQDTYMIFEPTPTLYDFFPLAVGNYWNYDYYWYSRTPNGSTIIEGRGTQSWQIVNESLDGEYTNFLVATVSNGIQYEGYDLDTTQPRYDTTLVQNDSSYFVIAADSSYLLNIKYLPIGVQRTKPFPRFQSLVHGDTATYCPDGTCKFVHDIGIVYLNLGFRDKIILRLIDYKINPGVMDSRRHSGGFIQNNH